MNILQLHWYLPNPSENLAGAGFGRISDKWPDSKFAGAGVEIPVQPYSSSTVKKVKERIAVNGFPLSQYGTSLAIWDHTVLPATRHKCVCVCVRERERERWDDAWSVQLQVYTQSYIAAFTARFTPDKISGPSHKFSEESCKLPRHGPAGSPGKCGFGALWNPEITSERGQIFFFIQCPCQDMVQTIKRPRRP